MELENRVAIVTGGAKGIGAAAALYLAREGASVAVLDCDAAAGGAIADELTAGGARARFVCVDIARAAECERAVTQVIEAFGGLDILVNNAGIQTFGGPVDTSEETWDRTMNVNLKGHWLMSKYAIPHMLARGKGAIVNVSSVQGLASQANVVAYSTSKHAMIGLTRTMAVDLARRGIRVNCVCPGTVDTPMIRWIIEQDEDPRPPGASAAQYASGRPDRQGLGDRRGDPFPGERPGVVHDRLHPHGGWRPAGADRRLAQSIEPAAGYALRRQNHTAPRPVSMSSDVEASGTAVMLSMPSTPATGSGSAAAVL